MRYQNLALILCVFLFTCSKPFCQLSPYFPDSLGSRWIYQVHTNNTGFQGVTNAEAVISKNIDSVTFERRIEESYISGMDFSSKEIRIDTCYLTGLMNCTSEYYPNPERANSTTPGLGATDYASFFSFEGKEFLKLENSVSPFHGAAGIIKVCQRDVGVIYMRAGSGGGSMSFVNRTWILIKINNQIVDTAQTNQIVQHTYALGLIKQKRREFGSNGLTDNALGIWNLNGRNIPAFQISRKIYPGIYFRR